MGCCQSTASNDEDRIPPPAQIHEARLPHDSSRAAINQPSRSLSNVDSPRASSTAQASHKPAGNARPNQPIRPPTPLVTSPAHVSHQPPPWTRSQLDNEREAFFDTRVSGQAEVWSALKLACEMLREDNVSEAQGILDAINVTCPNGRVAEGRGKDRSLGKGGVYDERGQLYAIPAWVLTDPEDVIEDDEEKDLEQDTDGANDDDPLGANAAARQQKRDEKGKGKAADLGEMVTVRARLSDRGTDVNVQVGTKEKVAMVVRRIQEQIGNKRIRLAYLGKVLDEHKTLEQQNWKQGNVLNALVFEGDESMLKRKGAK